MSELAMAIHKLFGTKWLRMIANHPTCNGLNEKINETTNAMLRKYADARTANWDEWLSMILFSNHATAHSSLNDTTYFFSHRRDSVLSLNVLFEIPEKPPEPQPTTYKHRVALRLRDAWNLV